MTVEKALLDFIEEVNYEPYYSYEVILHEEPKIASLSKRIRIRLAQFVAGKNSIIVVED